MSLPTYSKDSKIVRYLVVALAFNVVFANVHGCCAICSDSPYWPVGKNISTAGKMVMRFRGDLLVLPQLRVNAVKVSDVLNAIRDKDLTMDKDVFGGLSEVGVFEIDCVLDFFTARPHERLTKEIMDRLLNNQVIQVMPEN